jgi:hypothetical protein
MGVFRILFVAVWTLLIGGESALAFVTPSSAGSHRQQIKLMALRDDTSSSRHYRKNLITSSLVAASVMAAATQPLPVNAYSTSDYASEVVQEVVQQLKDASGNVEGTFKAYENIAEIITEGKGVGGMVNYKGIQLERGYIADEDTTIYNPGLTLLTESEKERLVDAIVNSRKVGLEKGAWSENNEFAFEFLKSNLDPLHMYELGGFLGFVPIYGAILYLVAFGAQQFARGIFPAVYLVCVAAFFLPIIALIAAGP